MPHLLNMRQPLPREPIGVFAAGVLKFLGAVGLPAAIGRSSGSVMLIVLAVTIPAACHSLHEGGHVGVDG